MIGLAAACAAPDEPVSNVRVGTSGQAMNAPLDPEAGSPLADVVVEVKVKDVLGQDHGGSGILITPRLALVAGHSASEAGPARITIRGTTYAVESRAYLSDGTPVENTGRDVGLMRISEYLDGVAKTSADAESTKVAAVVATRPSLAPVVVTASNAFPFSAFVAVQDGSGLRTAPVTGPVHVFDGTFWLESPTTAHGDSGGPLFFRRPDGTRNPIGLVSGVDERYIGYSGYSRLDLPEVKSFILANAVDSSRSTTWYRRHDKDPSNYWYGEADYTGECDKINDYDCDHWYTAHDNCPRTFNALQKDSDDDGVGDVCDLCAEAYDPRQLNCNADVETKTNAFKLGDLCDPTPCARAESFIRKTNQVCVPATPPYEGQNCTATPVADSFDVTALGSYPKTGGGRNPVPRVVPNVPTEFRFCQDVPSGDVIIDCNKSAYKSDQQLYVSEWPNRAEYPWHRVTVDNLSYAQPQTYTYGQTVTSTRWQYAADANRWFSGGQQLVPLPAGCTDPVKCLSGLFWYHASTDVGFVEHGSRADLTNSYYSVSPVRPTVAYCPLPTPELSWTLPAPTPRGLVLREIVVPAYAMFQEFRMDGRAASLVVPTYSEAGTLRGPAAIVRDDGSLISAGDTPGCGSARMDVNLRDKFKQWSWSSVVEPNEQIGSLSPEMVAVALDGTTVVDSVVVKGSALVSGGSPSQGGAPPSRTEPVTVLSRAAGGLFLMGGVGAADPGTVYFHPMPGKWRKTNYAFPADQTPLAATFTFADHRLWAVAQSGSTGLLVRIDPNAGVAETVMKFTLQENDRPYLSVDRDGSVLLARARGTSTALVRFVPVGERVQAETIAPASGLALRGPLAADAGYTFFTRSASGARNVSHVTSLPANSARYKCPTECDGLLP